MKETKWNYVSDKGTTLNEMVAEGLPTEVRVKLRPQ